VVEMLKGMPTHARKPCTAYWILELHSAGTLQPEDLSEFEDLINQSPSRSLLLMIKVFPFILSKKFPVVSLISVKESAEQTHTGP